MGPIGCPETSVRYYDYLLRNCPEECSSQGRICGHKILRHVNRLSDRMSYNVEMQDLSEENQTGTSFSKGLNGPGILRCTLQLLHYKKTCGVESITPGLLLRRLLGNIGLYCRVCIFFFFLARQPSVGQGLFIHEVSESHTTTRHTR
jgi:hypothetical protein